MGGPANLGLALGELNRIFLIGLRESLKSLGPLCGPSRHKAAPTGERACCMGRDLL
ncbi:conserved protein of unknown function [Pseudomonas sp. JV551A1]|uniref:Uncharacterized protein n=1 Tax=Pseudomonas inefficax TaxID=2078786 RepID=A0AAQ1P4L2_9PSED|nr:conserved protein of unknown function [Pseudomonas sp. JV551A1]SPO59662.1 conserved protein of unknown function [Pseudomonas inefficax]